MNHTHKKVVFIGDTCTGKSSLVHMFGNPTEHSTLGVPTLGLPTLGVPTLGVEVFPVFENKINVWDCAGYEKNLGLGDGYYIQADMAIIFHTTHDSRNWERDFRRVCENEPILHVLARCDVLTQDQKEAFLNKYPNGVLFSTKTKEGVEEIKKFMLS